MPSLMDILGYKIYFYSNEGLPLEPIHVHIGKNVTDDSAKVWITSDGKTLLEHNNGRINQKQLFRLIKTIEDYSDDIILKWKDYFDEIKFKDEETVSFTRKHTR